jgi:hypothetical protein
MDISKAPSPMGGSAGADGAAAALEGASLGLHLDMPGTPYVG